MNTPIADFVRGYEKQNMTRLHMPGHKGKAFLGCEALDITEVSGADTLYEAEGIIAESEANATRLFGTGRTIYSTEGSSQCIRAMLYLCMEKFYASLQYTSQQCTSHDCVMVKPTVLATRNVHKAFVYAAALLDLEVEWILPEGDMHSLCSCNVTASEIEKKLQEMEKPPIAVYVTSPDYLGGELNIKGIADVCHKFGTILAVDNAHGAYMHFLNPSRHPIDMGADICCDSAHKTLPVLTGGAYLQIGKNAPESFARNAKQAMALFGSTSPSYLILASMDLCNQYLENGYRERLVDAVDKLQEVRKTLMEKRWRVLEADPLKLTICVPKGLTGIELADKLRLHDVECEYADKNYVVCMATPENTEEDLQKLCNALGENKLDYEMEITFQKLNCKKKMSIRESIFAEHEVISTSESLGRICGSPTVSCPPAIPVVISGEVIDEEAVAILEYYGIQTIDVVKE
ncbi:MAG: amino acid decarboxylase [Faecalimonas sp.]|nr:amino acid decarboxylase [Faecalimonas sp.]